MDRLTDPALIATPWSGVETCPLCGQPPDVYALATESARRRLDALPAARRREIEACQTAAQERAAEIVAGRRDPLDG